MGHDKRLSTIRFTTYWPFRDDKGKIDDETILYARDLDHIKKSEIKD